MGSPTASSELAPQTITPRERARAVTEALLREAAWLEAFAGDGFSTGYADKAQEAQGLARSFKQLAVRTQTFAST